MARDMATPCFAAWSKMPCMRVGLERLALLDAEGGQLAQQRIVEEGRRLGFLVSSDRASSASWVCLYSVVLWARWIPSYPTSSTSLGTHVLSLKALSGP